MTKILGLDLGTNSIGWAILNPESQEVLGMGVRIFQEGVINLGQGEGREQSKNASRTAARSTRRQYFRRKLRRQDLLKILEKNHMCPVSEEEFSAWFKLPPYELRHRGLTEKLTLLEIGRALYHLSQRRGFQSNSRSAAANEDTVIYQTKDGLTGINETRKLITDSTELTLGSALQTEIIANYLPGDIPARRRRTERSMYIQEFEKLWEAQANFHEMLTSELKEIIGGRKKEENYTKDGVLFFQRPLKSQKSKVGKCSFETTKTKIPMSHPLFEKARTWQFINTIECDGEPLLDFERKKIYQLFLKKDRVRFKDIRRALNKLDDGYKFNYQDDETRPGCETIVKLSKKNCFGQEWFDFSEKKQEDIWHTFHFFDDKDKLKAYAQEKWGFEEDKASHAATKIFLKQGYGSLSRKAINNILRFLEKGYAYHIAVVMGGVKNAFGILWDGLAETELSLLYDHIPEIIGENSAGGFIDNLKDFLRLNFNFSETHFKKLYHHSANIHAAAITKRLPVGADADREISKIRNPIVIHALFELRKLVNQLIAEHGEFTQIKIELARDLKINKEERKRIRIRNKKQETYHQEIKKELERLGQYPNHENILKYKLWEECEKVCPYTGLKINLEQLFDGTFEIEHIVPFSKSLDDSYLNKTLCEAGTNGEKGNLTPFQYFSNIGGFEKFKNRVQKVFFDTKKFPNRYKKFKRLVSEKMEEDFISRQLNDTRYISKEAKNYLQKICKDVRVAPGQMTAKLRHHWGLNNIISHDNEIKNRKDHRHHAIDALVMACFKESDLHEISKWNRYNRSYDLKDFPEPLPNFRQQAIEWTKRILVSHKKSNRVTTTRQYTVKKNGISHTNEGIAARGQLHKETVYGKRKSPEKAEKAFHVRKPLNSFTKRGQLEKIVDKNIRQLIIGTLDTNGYFKKDGSILPGAFFEKNEATGRLMPKIFLPNKNGLPIPIQRVRVATNSTKMQPLRTEINQWVDPQNNHHVIIYKNENGKFKEQVVSFWEAVKSRRRSEKVFQLPTDGVELVTTLEINDLFLLNLMNEEIDPNNLDYRILSQHLYRVQSLSAGDYFFRHHLASTLDFKDDLIRIKSFRKWEELNPVKVRIASSGKLLIY